MQPCSCLITISQLRTQLVSFPEYPVTCSFRCRTQPDRDLYILFGFVELRAEPGRVLCLTLAMHIHQAAGNLNLATQGTHTIAQHILLIQRGITLL